MQTNLNKSINELTGQDLKDIKIICFDCDGVTVEKGTEIKIEGNKETITTKKLSPEMFTKLSELKKHFHLTFSSGRSMLYLTRVYGDLLWGNASLQAEIGLFVLYQGKLIQNFQLTDYELETFKKIKNDLLALNVGQLEPKQFLISLHCPQAYPQVDEIVKKNDPPNAFYCWWNLEAYDIAPQRINKGSGLQKLTELLSLSMHNVMTVGNGINDVNMTNIVGLDISTDPRHLNADFIAHGEHLGGLTVANKILSLL